MVWYETTYMLNHIKIETTKYYFVLNSKLSATIREIKHLFSNNKGLLHKNW